MRRALSLVCCASLALTLATNAAGAGRSTGSKTGFYRVGEPQHVSARRDDRSRRSEQLDKASRKFCWF